MLKENVWFISFLAIEKRCLKYFKTYLHFFITWMCVCQFFSPLSIKKVSWFLLMAARSVDFTLDLICIHFLCADVIDLSSSEDDHILHSQEKKKVEEEDEAVSEPKGAHTNDALNQPDAEGRVLVNFNHPAGEKDIFLAPQLARAVKPHQVPPPQQAAGLDLIHFLLSILCIINCVRPQVGGIRFLYDNLVESLDRFGSSSGFGCILAHSMGLGKTLQVISFIDVLFRHTQAHTVLAIVPVSTSATAPAKPEGIRLDLKTTDSQS